MLIQYFGVIFVIQKIIFPPKFWYRNTYKMEAYGSRNSHLTPCNGARVSEAPAVLFGMRVSFFEPKFILPEKSLVPKYSQNRHGEIMEADIWISYVVRLPGYKTCQQYLFSSLVSFFSSKKSFYPLNFATKILTK